jgi:tRNA U34 2-thiouridine synthase MnmA/TrmU
MSKVKALVLMSGGLDSMLAAKVLLEQGVEVTGIVFVSNFFGAAKARKAAEQLGVELKEIEFKKEHLKMVKNPKHGYGKNINPCIDCHALMLRYAKEIMESSCAKASNDKKEGYDFVATGEILGQRPMSQNKEALKTVAKESGLGDLLVRPLSAKLLEESRPEKEGKLIRGRLLDIKGRSRDRQKDLVEKFGIKEYASPGGGCLLTDPEFSQRLLKLFNHWPDCSGDDIELLKNGRVLWLKKMTAANAGRTAENNVLVVIGRDKEDCENLEKLAKKGDIMIKLKEIVGPTTLIRMSSVDFRLSNNELEIDIPNILKMSELKLGEEKSEEEILNIAALLTGYYAAKARGGKPIIKLAIIN